MIDVLHIIQLLTRGGASRALLALVPHSTRPGGVRHRAVSLGMAEPTALLLAEAAGLHVESKPAPEALLRSMADADIVFVHFWNNPEVYSLLDSGMFDSGLPPTRLALWCHIGGASAPQVITPDLIRFADLTLASCAFTRDLPVFRELSPEDAPAKTGLLHATTDFSRLARVQPQPHSGFPHSDFNVGYLGSVEFTKMHPDYVALCAAVDIPEVRFPVYGSGDGFETLAKQAQALGVADRFDLRGYVEDVGAALATMDVFGYPLRHDTYAATELVLLEAMAMGVPPVILAHGGPQQTIRHQETGLVAHSAQEYAAAIEYLYRDPNERLRLGQNGREIVQREYNPTRIAAELNRYLDRMMVAPKKVRQFPPPDATLLPYAADFPAALRFIRSLGAHALPFVNSLIAENTDEQLAADQSIMRSGVLLANEGTGGILAYRLHHPNDGFLRLWAGLALHGQGRFALAVAEFNQALKHGCDHRRVSWHLAQAAHAAGATALAKQAAQRVADAAPDFAPARQLLAQWDRSAQNAVREKS